LAKQAAAKKSKNSSQVGRIQDVDEQKKICNFVIIVLNKMV
jgi:hypothetical protein